MFIFEGSYALPLMIVQVGGKQDCDVVLISYAGTSSRLPLIITFPPLPEDDRMVWPLKFMVAGISIRSLYEIVRCAVDECGG